MNPPIYGEVAPAPLATNVYQSRWGYHSCSWSTYKQLRLLNRVYLKALRRAHAWSRWSAKAPHNRVAYPRVRDTQGRPCGRNREHPIPVNEPALCPVFHLLVTKRVQYPAPVDVLLVQDAINIPRLLEAASLSGRPAETPAQVQALPLSAAQIEELYTAAKVWEEQTCPEKPHKRPLPTALEKGSTPP